MRDDRNFSIPPLWPVLACVVALVFGAAASFAQKTTVQNAGGGRKIETDFDAAGQVTQQRSIGADGKLEQKVDYEHRPGYYVADQTTTAYWPNGKIRSVTKNTYDANANFTGEFVQAFDESGKHISGHRLTHDPMTGVYVCADWNAASQDYKKTECPAGEESGGGEEVKKFTAQEIMLHLDAARKAAQGGQKMQSTIRIKNGPTANREVGLVLPAEVHPGEHVSGSVVENPASYESIPALTVTRLTLPFESAGQAASLAGWMVETPGEKPQRADGPISLTVPSGGAALNVTFKLAGNVEGSVSKQIALGRSTAKKSKTPTKFVAQALCLKGEPCLVRGSFSGDSSKTFAAFEDRPAMIVAETPSSAYVNVPDATEAGSRPLFIAEGSKVVALPVTVAEFVVTNVDRDLQKGQTLMTFPTLDGPGDIPDAAWRPGNFPATNLDGARKLVPGFQPPKMDREAREKREAEVKGESKAQREADEKKGGTILLVVKNMTPEQISMRGAKDQMIVFQLTDESFSRGEFKYDLPVDALKSGHFDVKGYVIPFLAPVHGQEFPNK